MNQINPTIAAALKPFAPRLEAQVASAHRMYAAPPCPKDCFEWRDERVLMDTAVVCHLEYEAEERGGRENGLQMEPDYPAQATLVAAYIRDINIYDLLDSEQVSRIEADALRSLEGEWA